MSSFFPYDRSIHLQDLKKYKDRVHKGGEDLHLKVLFRASRASQMGCSAVVIMLDVFGAGDPDRVRNRLEIYQGLNVTSLPFDPSRLSVPMKVADKLRSGVES